MKVVLLFLRKKFRTSSLSACSGFKNSHSSLEKQNLRICFKKYFSLFTQAPHDMTQKMLLHWTQTFYENLL
jgi:hypothetical protein